MLRMPSAECEVRVARIFGEEAIKIKQFDKRCIVTYAYTVHRFTIIFAVVLLAVPSC